MSGDRKPSDALVFFGIATEDDHSIILATEDGQLLKTEGIG